jgi:hypothetical protein
MTRHVQRTTRLRALQTLAAVVLVAAGSHDAGAEPRALLVGIGEYPRLAAVSKTDPSLPGIDLDLSMMRGLAKTMGFRPEQIRVLYNEEATLDRVVKELSSWTREGVTENDPVLVYMSMHGSRVSDLNGDESDGQDEVLIMYDTGHAPPGSNPTLDRILVDDQFGELLAKIPSRHVLVLTDACHSGTATRAFGLQDQSLGATEAYPKFYYYDGVKDGTGVVSKASDEGPSNFVSLSAAQDTQYAMATVMGGLFTLGVNDAIRRAAVAKQNPTLIEVRDKVERFIAKKIDEQRWHNPVISGDKDLAEGGLTLVPLENGNGPVWTEVEQLASSSQALTVSTSKRSYRIGEEVEITVDVPMEGFLNIVSIDSQDSSTVLFPNQYQSENRVEKGPLTIPTSAMKFVLPAQEPAGPTLVAAFLSQQPLNLRELGIEGRNSAGKLTQTFTNLTAAATRAIGVAARKEKFHAGSTNVNVQRAE